jgi:hypothetical protein
MNVTDRHHARGLWGHAMHQRARYRSAALQGAARTSTANATSGLREKAAGGAGGRLVPQRGCIVKWFVAFAGGVGETLLVAVAPQGRGRTHERVFFMGPMAGRGCLLRGRGRWGTMGLGGCEEEYGDGIRDW